MYYSEKKSCLQDHYLLYMVFHIVIYKYFLNMAHNVHKIILTDVEIFPELHVETKYPDLKG